MRSGVQDVLQQVKKQGEAVKDVRRGLQDIKEKLNARLHTFADIWNGKVSRRFEVIEVDEFLTSLLTSA